MKTIEERGQRELLDDMRDQLHAATRGAGELQELLDQAHPVGQQQEDHDEAAARGTRGRVPR